MSKAYIYDGEAYDTEYECVRAIVESTYECDDEFWLWMDDVYSASDMYCMLVEMLNDMRTRPRVEDFRMVILDEYARKVYEDPERVKSMFEIYEVEEVDD